MASSAGAQVLSSPGRVWITGGGAYRDHKQSLPDGSQYLQIGGTTAALAPWDLHFSGAYFFNSFLGVDLEARSEHFYATQTGTRPVPQPSGELTMTAAGRWVPLPWLSLEGQFGWGLQLRSVILAGPVQAGAAFTGPAFGVAVGLSPSRHFATQLFFRAHPVGISLGDIPGFQGRALAGGAQISVGAWRIGDVQVAAAVTLELTSSRLSSFTGATDQFGARLGAGFSLMRAPDDPLDPTGPTAQKKKVKLQGRVVSAEGAPVTGVVVTLDGESPVRTSEAGTFDFLEVSIGAHVLRARKEGFKAGMLEVAMTETQSLVTVTLAASTGPGRIRGVISSEGKAVADAAVSSGAQKVTTDAEGRFALDEVGPGPVNVQVKATGFNDAEEIAQVPADGAATLDFTLVPRAVEVRATLRGLIRAKSGETLKATVRVVERKLKLQVKADGRFSADVPSGKYTLIIEARGYVTQTKTVEVSGGDQAIFHAELERTR